MNGLDVAVIAGYGLLVVAVGLWAGRSPSVSDHPDAAQDWLLGSRRVPVVIVLLSMVATELSAATFLGVPQAAFVGDWSYLQLAFGALLGKAVVAGVAIPLYYRLGLVTVYGLLESRYGPGARRAAAICFVGGRILASGVRLFIAALAMAVVTDTSLTVAVVVCGLVAGLYTLVGGIRSVVWTDAIQAVVFLGGAGALLMVAGAAHPDGLAGIFEWARDGERTRIFTVDPLFALADARPLGVGIVGGFFLTLATHATDHDMVQRLLTARNARGGSGALLGSAVLNFPLSALFLAVGTAIAWFAATHTGFAVDDPSRVVPEFALAALPAGLRGLVFAGILAAAMSSLDSAVCAIASTWVVDVRPRAGPDTEALTRRTRVVAAVVTLALILAALGMNAYRTGLEAREAGVPLVELALSAMTILYGGLLGVFALGIASPRARGDLAAWGGLATGAAIGLALFAHPLIWGETLVAWPWWIPIASTAAGLAAAGLSRSSSAAPPGAPVH